MSQPQKAPPATKQFLRESSVMVAKSHRKLIVRNASGTYVPSGYAKHSRWLHLQILVTALGIASMSLLCGGQQEVAQKKTVDTEKLMERIGQPSEQALKIFKMAGMKNITAHTLTAPERAKVEAALESLPSLNRQMLGKHLHHLAFVDGIPGEGTGLTSPLSKTVFYDITLRASILDESLSTFLTNKEVRVFKQDGTGVRVMVEATGADALTYVLLHESSHVLDKGCRITAKHGSTFVAGIWKNQSQLVSQLASLSAARTIFRGGRPLEFGQAAGVYEALAQTPFVSLYATVSALEDFAELVAWRQIQMRFHGNLAIMMIDAGGRILRRWEPLTFPALQRRFNVVDSLLRSGHCAGSL